VPAVTRRREARRPSTPEENRRRNIERIMNPPKPTLYERVCRRVWGVREWWWRHVSQRKLSRLLDNARLNLDALRAAHRCGADCGCQR